MGNQAQINKAAALITGIVVVVAIIGFYFYQQNTRVPLIEECQKLTGEEYDNCIRPIINKAIGDGNTVLCGNYEVCNITGIPPQSCIVDDFCISGVLLLTSDKARICDDFKKNIDFSTVLQDLNLSSPTELVSYCKKLGEVNETNACYTINEQDAPLKLIANCP